MKYKFYTNGSGKIIATSTYAGKTVRGVAKCSMNDEFNLEKGQTLAAARCNSRVAHKRRDNAFRKYTEAQRAFDVAQAHLRAMESYYDDAYDAMLDADNAVEALLSEM